MNDYMCYGNGIINEFTKDMISLSHSELAKLIGEKWFNTLDKLVEASGLGKHTLLSAIEGKKISPTYEKKLRAFLEQL